MALAARRIKIVLDADLRREVTALALRRGVPLASLAAELVREALARRFADRRARRADIGLSRRAQGCTQIEPLSHR